LQLCGSSNSEEYLMLFQAIATPNHFHLPHLTSLHLEEMRVTNESITVLCNSVYAKQLTSLCLKELHGMSFETYQQVFTSFSQLQSFELVLDDPNLGDDEMPQKEYCKQLFSLFDDLFDDNCAFVNTLQSLTVEAFCYDTSSTWKDQQSKEEMLHNHLISHWKFPFHNLQSCNLDLRIGDSPVAALMTKRLLVNCPALHTIDLRLMRDEHAIQFTQQPEMIRRMKERRLL